MSPHIRIALVVVAATAAYLGWVFVSRRTPGEAPVKRPPAVYQDFEGIDKLTSVTILRFYSGAGVLDEGQAATLCYGVAKARAVRLDPPVEQLSPSLNRCFQVSPHEDTRYTLTAEGDDGRTVSESFALQVRPDPQNVPTVTYFIPQKKGAPGENVYSLCFAVENAARVAVDPPVIPAMEGAPRGCFYVSPQRTTTYTLILTGRTGRTASRQVTVKVP